MVIGANSPQRRGMGRVAARIIAQAPCTVTLVRLPQPIETAPEDADAATEPDGGFGI